MDNEEKFLNIVNWPWQNGDDPYWINSDNGHMWYIDKEMTDYANDPEKPYSSLGAVCFIVAEEKDKNIKPVTRVLMDKKSNDVLFETGNLENMAIKIDILRFIKSTTEEE